MSTLFKVSLSKCQSNMNLWSKVPTGATCLTLWIFEAIVSIFGYWENSPHFASRFRPPPRPAFTTAHGDNCRTYYV